MQVKKLIILALSLSILSLCAYAQGKTITVEQAAREAVSEDDLRAAVDSLCSKEFGGRATGTQGAKACREYIGRSFRENGATVTDMEFPCPDGPGHDIIAFHCTNKVSPPSSYIVIMAYYDGLGSLNGKTYPGADSNASGVSALLALSRMLGKLSRMGCPLYKSVVLVALDAHYRSSQGSKALLDAISNGSLKDPYTGTSLSKGSIYAIANIEQIGSSLSPLSSGREDYLIMLGDYFRGTLAQTNSDIGLDLSFDYYGSQDFTTLFYRKIGEQRGFVEAGYPCVMFTSGITMNNNKPSDTPSTLEFPVLRKRVWAIFGWLLRCAS